MSRDQLSTPSLGAEHSAGVNWTSLLNAIGTDQFEPVLKRFVADLVGGDGRCRRHGQCRPFTHRESNPPWARAAVVATSPNIL